MQASTKKFSELGLHGKMTYLRRHGSYIATRRHHSFEVHLYSCSGFYAEVWMRIGFQQVYWIEPTPADRVAENYLDDIDLGPSLGL